MEPSAQPPVTPQPQVETPLVSNVPAPKLAGGIPIGTPPDTVIAAQQTSNKPIDPDAAAQQFAVATGFPYVDASNLDELELFTDPIDAATMQQYHVVPLRRETNTQLEYGITPLSDKTKLPELQSKYPGVHLLIKTISERHFNPIHHRIFLATFDTARQGDYSDFTAHLQAAAPKDAFQHIAQLAYLMGASDIHIEAEDGDVRVRYRLDGVLHPITSVSHDAYKVFLADLQTKAQMKWGGDVPQSGRISFDLVATDGSVHNVNMRLETIPSFHGEEIVVRLFNAETRLLTLDSLGFSDEQQQRILHLASHPNGMILTVGPTGSGKTSTLYSLINHLNNPETKIVTLEDPVEFNLDGITQIAVHTEDKESFADKLRAVMREDPNVVMIGEIRDVDTARTALQAALTGHLVLSTFHAGSASAAIARMVDMMQANPLLASSIKMIIAQRLVRRICTHCAQTYEPSAEQRAMIEAGLSKLQAEKRPSLDGLQLKRGVGCPHCHGIGYMGRICLVEMLPLTAEIEAMMADPKVTARQIEAKAIEQGMTTLYTDGILKVVAGITTLEEVDAVVGA